jgi:hypothetical protein
MEVLLILTVGAVNVLCFFIGAKVGQTVAKGETIKTPEVNPIKAYNEHKAQKEAEKEAERLEVIMRNIETYDGTGKGQASVPGGK